MNATHESPTRREARCRARSLVLSATPDQIDSWRDRGETRANCVDRLLRLLGVCPFVVLGLIGGCAVERPPVQKSEPSVGEISERMIVAERQFGLNGGVFYLIRDARNGNTCYAIVGPRYDSGHAISCIKEGE